MDGRLPGTGPFERPVQEHVVVERPDRCAGRRATDEPGNVHGVPVFDHGPGGSIHGRTSAGESVPGAAGAGQGGHGRRRPNDVSGGYAGQPQPAVFCGGRLDKFCRERGKPRSYCVRVRAIRGEAWRDIADAGSPRCGVGSSNDSRQFHGASGSIHAAVSLRRGRAGGDHRRQKSFDVATEPAGGFQLGFFAASGAGLSGRRRSDRWRLDAGLLVGHDFRLEPVPDRGESNHGAGASEAESRRSYQLERNANGEVPHTGRGRRHGTLREQPGSLLGKRHAIDTAGCSGRPRGWRLPGRNLRPAG